ncbi:MAG: hypothetical protein PHQ52_03440 [Candidatus Omnitrophica bacterium]|nr:hypothetical protein [Candidatus Omnitrophota bacterium]
MRKQYKYPRIKAVILDPEQAILEVCQIGGVYFFKPAGTSLCGIGVGKFGPYCDISVRGITTSTAGLTNGLGSAKPS